MDFINDIITKDKELFVYLNGLGTESWDQFWVIATNQFSWTPWFLMLFFLIFRAYGWKKGLLLMLITAILVTFSDQFVNLIKDYFGRLRPNNDPELKDFIRILHHSGSFSFVSGHSTTSFAVTTFIILTLREFYKYPYLLLIWPIIFAYSRIYVGVHYPVDIFIGMLLGITIGYVFRKISIGFLRKIH